MTTPLIILTGPTAVGKTDLSIQLAKAVDAEIVSADSMQIYKYMDIGSAKVTEEEMQGVKHYLVDEIEPDMPFSVSEYKRMAEEYIDEISSRGKNVIVTGGTGLYLNSLIFDMDFGKSDANQELREELNKELEENGPAYMYEKLVSLDKEASERIHPNNTKRVIRAIEVAMSGEKMNDFSKDLRYNKKYRPIIIVLNRDRQALYDRINLRVDIMLKNGLIEEVKGLLEKGYTKDMISMQGIGYKEIIKYFDGEYTLDEAIEIIKRDSRRYAKRQLTWFRRYEDAKWFEIDKFDSAEELKDAVVSYVKEML